MLFFEKWFYIGRNFLEILFTPMFTLKIHPYSTWPGVFLHLLYQEENVLDRSHGSVFSGWLGRWRGSQLVLAWYMRATLISCLLPEKTQLVIEHHVLNLKQLHTNSGVWFCIQQSKIWTASQKIRKVILLP